MVVDQEGQRFANESGSYVAFGMAQHNRNRTVTALPAWVIMEARYIARYRFAYQPAGKIPPEWLSAAFVVKAASIAELAEKCGINPVGLAQSVARFNEFARTGVDEDYHRGRGAFDRWFGDPRVGPNPNLGGIVDAPFYAVRTYPGDVGTFGGLVTDEYARVLREDGTVIAGLYATGNTTSSVVGRSYPGAGASISASLIFGYIASRHATGG
jgi:3-oxosteroid 1-dehydrogenase